MKQTPQLWGYDDTPVYTIKTVVQRTGITPATLRAWERRYGILSPERSEGGYRLYSEQDIVRLRWLKGQVESGVNISRAVALLEAHALAGNGTERMVSARAGDYLDLSRHPRVRSPEVVAGELLQALLVFNENEAGKILNEAFAFYSPEIVTETIMVKALVEAGARWQHKDISLVQERFTASFLRRRLAALFSLYSQPVCGPLAVIACAPDDWHDVGALIVSLVLRRNGWRVIFVGPSVPAAHLASGLSQIKPDCVCLSATLEESVPRLAEVVDELRRLPQPQPRLVVGGQAFNANPHLRQRFPEAFLGPTPGEAVLALTESQ